MNAFILLVTWFAYGQPPSSYQTVFNSAEACGKARQALVAEAERMRMDVGNRAAAAAKEGKYLPASEAAPKVSAICTPQA
jgi:hypothetical protein